MNEKLAIEPEDRFVRIGYLREKLGFGESTIYGWIAKGKLPAGIKISPKMTVWKKSTIDNIFNELSA